MKKSLSLSGVSNIQKLLASRALEHGLRKTAREAGIPHGTLHQYLNHPRSMTFDAAAQVAQVLGAELVVAGPNNCPLFAHYKKGEVTGRRRHAKARTR